MGAKLGDLIVGEEISLDSLSGKKIAVDAYNTLYQFLTTIRQQDGTPLMDRSGRITSHLSGLFFRTSRLLKAGIKPAFVFDGKAPELKRQERQRRSELKKDALEKYKEAEAEGDVELMRKYASRTATLTAQMIEESKELISLMGLPIIDAPSEGEAQAAHLVKKGEFYAVASQDTDSLLFGATRIIRNLSVSNKKKKGVTYVSVDPEKIELSNVLIQNKLDQSQLIVLAILCGTDFNIGGIKGIGPKKALALLSKFDHSFDTLFEEVKWKEHFTTDWKEIYSIFEHIPVTDEYELKWSPISHAALKEYLIAHDFSEERIESSLSELTKKQSQRGLSDFF
ncbi:MAG: flap endonuclease-1 [Nanoarchaeota archaeon]|nr:flap endonuclease-1 [Nanoarchaeota archaeon]